MKIILNFFTGLGLITLVFVIGCGIANVGVPTEYQNTLNELGFGHYIMYGINNVFAYFCFIIGLISILIGAIMIEEKFLFFLLISIGIILIGFAYLVWKLFLPFLLAH